MPLYTTVRELADNPHRGKPLRYDLASTFRTHLGVYRMIHEIDEETKTAHNLVIEHRDKIYSP